MNHMQPQNKLQIIGEMPPTNHKQDRRDPHCCDLKQDSETIKGRETDIVHEVKDRRIGIGRNQTPSRNQTCLRDSMIAEKKKCPRS